MKLAIAVLIVACPASAFAQKLDVTIVDRQDNETEYTYTVPGSFSSNSNSSAKCIVSDTNANCNGSTTTNGYRSVLPRARRDFCPSTPRRAGGHCEL
jgi:predicted porin